MSRLTEAARVTLSDVYRMALRHTQLCSQIIYGTMGALGATHCKVTSFMVSPISLVHVLVEGLADCSICMSLNPLST
jgi:hypothetical protein